MQLSNKFQTNVVCGVVNIITRHGTILVDENDYEKTLGRHLRVNKYGYAIVHVLKGDPTNSATTGLHRIILNAPSEMLVDHINRNPLDNRRCNLRLCTMSQNKANSEGKRGRMVPYKGLRFNKRLKNKWQSRICVNGRIRHLGSFPTAELAAIAYNVAAVEEYGEFACLNVIQHKTDQQLLAI